MLFRIDTSPKIHVKYFTMCSIVFSTTACSFKIFASILASLTYLYALSSLFHFFVGHLIGRNIALQLSSIDVKTHASAKSHFCLSALLCTASLKCSSCSMCDGRVSYSNSLRLGAFSSTYFQSSLRRRTISMSFDREWNDSAVIGASLNLNVSLSSGVILLGHTKQHRQKHDIACCCWQPKRVTHNLFLHSPL